MTVGADVEAEIRRLYYAEHWPVGTIARELGVHHGVVRRVLALRPHDDPRPAPSSVITPYAGVTVVTRFMFLGEGLRAPVLRADPIRER